MTDSDSSNDDCSVDKEILYSDDDEVSNSLFDSSTEDVTPSLLTTMKRALASRSALEHRLVKKLCCSFVQFRYTLAICKHKLLVATTYNTTYKNTSAMVCKIERGAWVWVQSKQTGKGRALGTLLLYFVGAGSEEHEEWLGIPWSLEELGRNGGIHVPPWGY